MEKCTVHNTTSGVTSRSLSKRTSATTTLESLPASPLDSPGIRSGSQDNVFRYNVIRKDLTRDLNGLLKFGERQNEFQKRLKETIWNDCPQMHKSSKKEEPNHCECCEKLYKEYKLIMEPLQSRLNTSVTRALAAYECINQLDHLYKIWDRYLSLERTLRQNQCSLDYVDLLKRKLMDIQCSISNEGSLSTHSTNLSDTEMDSKELDQLFHLLENILELKKKAATKFIDKNSESKIQRERSKSFVIDETLQEQNIISNTQPLLRRQSAFVDSKSKVSKWTKVKAAFKWEKAHVTTPIEHSRNDLTPNNTEVARYLCVPSIPYGGSSPESAFSSSSGHFFSEHGTPGTISSASSMDDFDNDKQTNKTNNISRNRDENFIFPADDTIRHNTGLRKTKLAPDMDVVLENIALDTNTITRLKNRKLPSPLNLHVKEDFTNLNGQSHFKKNELPAQDGTQSLNRTLYNIISSANFSAPSSPSRYSNSFVEYESEVLSSSADFSDPNMQYSLGIYENFEEQQREINRRYEALRIKLGVEFEAKRNEWNKMKANRAMAFLSAYKSNNMAIGTNTANKVNKNLPNEILEESVTPDFRKKLQKWRVKKQASMGGLQTHLPTTPTLIQDNEIVATNKDTKIDWQLWKTGQLKLEGQGLTPLPDQKDLPEDFQKKLQQWDKIKRGGTSLRYIDTGKQTLKCGSISTRKSQSDEEKKTDKHKAHDKEKLERLAKLKTILGEHFTKEIEVKTSAGVMKFEGISRKFTRKLYEWEKAKGIGPESSTFALLHPGYCPIDVKRILNDRHETSPNLSHSLSMDSLSPTLTISGMSHQASSLSLNDVKALKDIAESNNYDNNNNSTDNLVLNKASEEPETTTIEVEDHIKESASKLINIADLNQKAQNDVCIYKQTPGIKLCKARKVHSFDGNINAEPLLNVLKNSENLLELLKTNSFNMDENVVLKQCLKLLAFIRYNYLHYSDNIMNSAVLNSISDVQNELGRLRDLCIKVPVDLACCKEIIEQRNHEYNVDLEGLQHTLRILCANMHHNKESDLYQHLPPDINQISEVGIHNDHKRNVEYNHGNQMPIVLNATTELNSLAINSHNNNNESINSCGCGKKRVRLRKVASLRQNNKTDSDSSDYGLNHSIAVGTPRHYKRRNYRLKQRSFENDPKALKKLNSKRDNHHMWKNGENQHNKNNIESSFTPLPLTTSISLPDVFVKTKKKLVTTIEKLNTINGVTVINQATLKSPLNKIYNKESTNEKCEFPRQSKDVVRKDFKEKELKTDFDIYLSSNLLLLHKSFSLNDLQSDIHCDNRKRIVHSMENMNSLKPVHQPLASDSLRLLYNYKRKTKKPIDARINVTENRSGILSKKGHIFKKHNEDSDKIGVLESKAVKSHSINVMTKMDSIDMSQKGASDKRLSHCSYRKDEGEMARLVIQNHNRCSDTASLTNIKSDMLLHYTSVGSCTHLSERALRLRKAKEDFLNNYYQSIVGQGLKQKLNSDESILSLSSKVADDDFSKCSERTELKEEEEEDINDIQRSVSADMVRRHDTPTCSDTGTEIEYDDSASIYRPVRRCKNITSKFGFSTLASKFRKVTASSKKHYETIAPTAVSNASAITVLCRQSLQADVIAMPQTSKMAIDEKFTTNEGLMKSKSSPSTSSFWCTVMSKRNNDSNVDSYVNKIQTERVNKSSSDQYVRRHRKESFV